MHDKSLEELPKVHQITDSWQDRKVTIHELWHQLKEQYQTQLLDEKRNFADMVLQPQSAAEMNLIETAMQCLPAPELSDAIRNNLPASSVIAKIERAKIIKQNLEFAHLHQQRLQLMQNIAQKPVINSYILFQEFGILNEITKNITHADKLKLQRENITIEPVLDTPR